MYEYSFKTDFKLESCEGCPMSHHTDMGDWECGHTDGPMECSEITRPVDCPLVEKEISNESKDSCKNIKCGGHDIAQYDNCIWMQDIRNCTDRK